MDLRRADPRLHDVVRLGVYQLRFLDRVPPYAAVTTSVALARERAGDGAARYVNHTLRRVAREGEAHGAPRATHPPWLVRRWEARFGAADTQRLVAWNDTRPVLTLQPARWEPDTLRRHLEQAGLAVHDAPYGTGLRVERGASRLPLPALRVLPGYIEGGFVVQDPAHALVCRFAAVPAGALVYDACAAPGGKAVALARAGARVVAGDARRERLPRLADTISRAAPDVHVVAADVMAAPFADARFDAVLVDAPCSATGTMARHPDARSRVTPRAITALAARQHRMLDAAARLVRSHGVLVYATCSLEPEENADQVNAFLERHPEFVRAPVSGAVAAALLTEAGDFASLPQRDAMDGAFAARLERRR